MNENNGQYCQLCKRNIARLESYCGVIYLCDKCASDSTMSIDSLNDADAENRARGVDDE